MQFRTLALALALWAQCASSMATLVTSQYRPLGGSAWSVSFTVLNDGPLAEIGGFTIYFPETGFSVLTLDGFPATWDTLVIQPDLGIPAAGFLDAFAIDAADRLVSGDSIGGFQIVFQFLGPGAPSRLAFDIVDANFNIVDTGFTEIPSGGPIPEPTTIALVIVALTGAALSQKRLRKLQRRSFDMHSAPRNRIC